MRIFHGFDPSNKIAILLCISYMAQLFIIPDKFPFLLKSDRRITMI